MIAHIHSPLIRYRRLFLVQMMIGAPLLEERPLLPAMMMKVTESP